MNDGENVGAKVDAILGDMEGMDDDVPDVDDKTLYKDLDKEINKRKPVEDDLSDDGKVSREYFKKHMGEK